MLALLLFCTWTFSPVKVVGKRMTGDDPKDVRSFITPGGVARYNSIQQVMDAWTAGYHYQPDRWYIANEYGQVLSLGPDTMLTGVEIQRIMNTTNQRYWDCDKGAIWGTSALRAAGYDAWLCAGSLEQWDDDGNYLGTAGHAWVLVKTGGKWYLWETTIYDDTHAPVLIPWPVQSPQVHYRLDWRTNGYLTIRQPFRVDYGGFTSPTLDPSMIPTLRDALAKSRS